MPSRITRLRRSQPTERALRLVFLGALVMNTVIVVTGGAVRLTASGLGCPTFPRCTDESLVVTREMGAHGFIEFGNRMLTFVLAAAVLAALFTAWRARDAVLVRLAGLLLLGIVVQAGLGGVTVLTGLNPVTVMAHFLLSMLLIGVAVVAYERTLPAGPVSSAPRELRLGGLALVLVVAAVLFVGTVVTGTGPHSGDKQAADRLPFDLVMVTQLHADLVFLLLGLAVGLLIAVRMSTPHLDRRAAVLVGVILGQGTIGYVQYATDLPVAVVAAHLLGACLVWISALRLLLGIEGRRGTATSVPQAAAEPVAATPRRSPTSVG